MKHVYLLIRTSTGMQDITMQKTACRQFVSGNPDWQIKREYVENGISGSKISAKRRDAIQQIRDAALNGEFSILLVYMFDRLGRRDDETPFLVEWFVRHGIEVWSVIEGQQRFESHIDKLLNYIRFWQASGESQMLSTRITTKLEQMAQAGIYRGGYVPFGYKLEKLGRINHKGHEVRDMVIDPEKAEIVRMIFQKAGIEGYSSSAIAKLLNAIGIPTPNVAMHWRASSLRSIMKNPIYTGIIRHRGKLSEPFEKYRLVSDVLFSQVQQNMETRKKLDKPFCTNAYALLTGLLTCGCCHEKLAINRYCEKRKGVPRDRTYYRCYSRMNSTAICSGQAAYKASRIDSAVLRSIGSIIHSIDGKMMRQIWGKIYETMQRVYREQKQLLDKSLSTAQREEQLLRNALVDALIGKNQGNADLINERLEEQTWRIDRIKKELAQIDFEFQKDCLKADTFMQPKSISEEVFSLSDMLTQRKVLEQLVSKIVISTGYHIDIYLKCSAKGLNACFGLIFK